MGLSHSKRPQSSNSIRWPPKITTLKSGLESTGYKLGEFPTITEVFQLSNEDVTVRNQNPPLKPNPHAFLRGHIRWGSEGFTRSPEVHIRITTASHQRHEDPLPEGPTRHGRNPAISFRE